VTLQTPPPRKKQEGQTTLPIVADQFAWVVGVDTHARTHTFTLIESRTGAAIGTEQFPTSTAGMTRALSWIHRHTENDTVYAAVEGTSSYSSRLTRMFEKEGIPIGEARPPSKASRARTGKSDAIDAEAAARSMIGRDIAHIASPRAAGLRQALQILLTSRALIDQQRTANKNALTALLRVIDLDIDARKPLTDRQVATVAAWRTTDDTAAITIARAESKRLAIAVITATGLMESNRSQLAQLAEQLAPGFQETPGVGPVTAAIIICAYSHPGRVRSEAAFASLGGVAPRPASSGNTTRHRLNRTGDRQLNRAFDVIARTRMSIDDTTRAYVVKSREAGKTNREIRRKLKRYICRQIFRQISAIVT